MAMLALMVGGMIGPITVPGLTTTTSNPSSLANSHAAFSASVLDAGYHSWRGKTTNREIFGNAAGNPTNGHYGLRSHLFLLAVVKVGPAALVLDDVRWPSGAGNDGGYGRRDYHPAHPALVGGT